MPYSRQRLSAANWGSVSGTGEVTSDDVTIPANTVLAKVEARGASAGPGTNDQVAVYWQAKNGANYIKPGMFLGVIDRYNEDQGGDSGLDEELNLPAEEGRLMARTVSGSAPTATVTMTGDILVTTYVEPS